MKEMWIWLLLNLTCLVAVKAHEKTTCFTPAICSVGDASNLDWVEYDPKEQCKNKHSPQANVPNVASSGSQSNLNGSQVKSLIKEHASVVRTHSENLTYSMFNKTNEKMKEFQDELENLNNTLRKDSEDLRSQVINLTDSLHYGTNVKMEEFQEKLENFNNTFEMSANDLRTQLINLTDSKFDETTEQLREFQSRLDTLNNTTERNFILLRSHLENLTISLNKIVDIQNEQGANKPEKSDVICRDVNGTFYLGKCYWLILHSRSVNFAQAETLCKEKGGKPGDVLDGFHYNMIVGMARATMTSDYVNIWIGTTINAQTKVLTTYSGKETTYKKWLDSGWPSSTASQTHIMLYIDRNSTSRNGMVNYPPTSHSHGILCVE